MATQEEHTREALYRERIHGETIAVLRVQNERLRAALREALERATACAPVDRLDELEPLWAVLDDDNPNSTPIKPTDVASMTIECLVLGMLQEEATAVIIRVNGTDYTLSLDQFS